MYAVYRPAIDIDKRPAPGYCEKKGPWLWIEPIPKQQSLLPDNHFCFLNKTFALQFSSDWNNPGIEKLFLYHLHYFDDLNAENNSDRKALHQKLVTRWINENSPGTGNGWEPYPLSLRIVNWIKWHMSGNYLNDEQLNSLACQARYLFKKIEFHLLGNHIFANAKALVFAGLFFQGKEAGKWFCRGIEILKKEVREQILDDGGHFERSPMYQTIILEDVLDLINMGRACPETFSAEKEQTLHEWEKVACRMMTWLKIMCHPDGRIVLFNDAAMGLAAEPSEIFFYAEKLGLHHSGTQDKGFVYLSESGYIRCEKGRAVAFLDVADIGPDYIPGHGHADTLTFEFSFLKKRVIVDSGISCYGTDSERLRQRGTAAHNTVTINNMNSSDVWKGFRVGRRARPFDLEINDLPNETIVRCCHDGYQHFPGKPVHCREWRLEKKQFVIKDVIKGTFHNAVGRFYFHPDVDVEIDETSGQGQIRVANGHLVKWKVRKGNANLVPATFHPEFGVSLPNQCLEVSFTASETEIIFCWD